MAGIHFNTKTGKRGDAQLNRASVQYVMSNITLIQRKELINMRMG